MQVANTIAHYRKKLDEALVEANRSIEANSIWINPWEATPEVTEEWREEDHEYGATLGKWRVVVKTDNHIKIELPEVPEGSVFHHHFHKCLERVTVVSGGLIVRFRNGDWMARSVIAGQSLDIPAGYLHHMYWEADTHMFIEYFK